jgi:hypothetical protein
MAVKMENWWVVQLADQMDLKMVVSMAELKAMSTVV